MVSGRSIVAALLLLLALPALSSETGTALTGDSVEPEPVKVYTNADLEKYGPVSDTPVPEADGSGWEFVTEFLEREHKRLDADRAHDLERLRVEAETEALTRSRERSYLPFVPYVGRPWKRYGPSPAAGHDFRGSRGSRGYPRSGHGLPSVAYPRSPMNHDIVPLHARPTLALRHRARAIQHSGADAVPKR